MSSVSKVLPFNFLHIKQFGKVLHEIKDLGTYLHKYLDNKPKCHNKHCHIVVLLFIQYFVRVILHSCQVATDCRELFNLHFTMPFNLASCCCRLFAKSTNPIFESINRSQYLCVIKFIYFSHLLFTRSYFFYYY